jgi:hypothetical protein
MDEYPLPLKWSIPMSDKEEDQNAEEASQAGRDRCEAAPVDVLSSQGQSMPEAIRAH